MGLKDFITETIKEISDAIDNLTASDIHIITHDNFKTKGEHYTLLHDNGLVRNIEFELSIEASEENTNNGEVGIRVAKAYTENHNTINTAHKIRFSIPVSFHKSNPTPHQQ